MDLEDPQEQRCFLGVLALWIKNGRLAHSALASIQLRNQGMKNYGGKFRRRGQEKQEWFWLQVQQPIENFEVIDPRLS
jgi:hypothetical protein